MSEPVIDTRDARKRRAANLGRLLRPRHIAFIGSGQAAGVIAACRRAGFAGKLWAVHPTRETLGDVACVPTVADLTEPPDAALLALSPERTVDMVEILAKSGAGGAVCMAAGFAESGEKGRALQARLSQVAGDLAVLGPNCMGVINHFDGAAVWGSENHIERTGGPGAAIISQSGAFLFGITNVEQAFPLGYAISTGNQAVVDTADCINAVLDDDRIKAIGVYIEGLEHGNALGRACWRALQKGVPVVALKGGDTPAGATVAIGHTGAMVIERDMWEAFAERHGIVEVSSPKGLVESLKMLTVGGVPKGWRLNAVTFSGGLNGLIASRAPILGLDLAAPGEENVARVRAVMPETVPVANPLDLNLPWTSKTGLSMEDGDTIGASIADLADGTADMVAFFLDVPRVDENRFDADWLPAIESMTEVRQKLDVPCAVAGILPEGLDVALRHRLIADGVAPLLGFNDAMEALSVAAKCGAHIRAKSGRPYRELLELDAARPTAPHATRMLDEAESKTVLRSFGLRTPQFWGGPAHAALDAAEQIGFPVALKVLSPQIAHKAAVGGVRLGLSSRDAVTDAIATMREDLAANGLGDQSGQVLVEAMIQNPIAEFIIGTKRHAALGQALIVGRGGRAVEALRDFQTVLLPLNDGDLDAALDRLGVPPDALGHAALKNAVAAVAACVTANGHLVDALDVNPVILTAAGDAIATDALIVTSSADLHQGDA